jgi:large conductance mechanosensitive channel
MPKMTVLDEFKEFALKGSMIDLAVGVVIGVAFNAVVQSFANDILLALVAALFGEPSFANLHFTINGAVIGYGIFLTTLVNFVIVAFGVFLVIKFINRLRRPDVDVPPTSQTCPYCLTVVPTEATRCSACTSELSPAGGGSI